MLNHVAIGPLADGNYAAAYQTPGCNVMTLAAICATHLQALEASARLNAEQLRIEVEIRRERALCGLQRAVNDLRDM